jgi:predicted small lipoprotein YifL
VILNVKSPFALLTSLATLMALSACGQTGPLYMPKPPARTPAAHTAAAPAGTPTNTANTNGAAVQISPPAPAAGVTVPAAGSNANNTEATNQPPPATQQ